ncbi:unnamed protein product [Mesocestoides corti]|uniref:Uncharacterized protein n=1 Tax=Mesocestoides corti TaxID=53468 RepID=A0A0R3UKL8_MESCO|nr:unnamed protein product [Mesocestoides corti]
MDDESFLQVYKSKVSRQLFALATILPDVGCGECRTGYFTNTGNQQQSQVGVNGRTRDIRTKYITKLHASRDSNPDVRSLCLRFEPMDLHVTNGSSDSRKDPKDPYNISAMMELVFPPAVLSVYELDEDFDVWSAKI